MGTTEADTCRKFVLPRLLAAGWDSEPHSIAEQRTFTDGRIFVVGSKTGRRKQKRADYLLRYTRDIALAVVEAKAEYKLPGDGLQQAKDCAETLNLEFAYSTNVRRRRLNPQSFLDYVFPLPSMQKQIQLRSVRGKADELKRLQAETQAELNALMPSILDRAFKGEL